MPGTMDIKVNRLRKVMQSRYVIHKITIIATLGDRLHHRVSRKQAPLQTVGGAWNCWHLLE